MANAEKNGIFSAGLIRTLRFKEIVMLSGSSILVTGGTGSFSHTFCSNDLEEVQSEKNHHFFS